MNPGNQLHGAEGFRHIIVSAVIQPGDFVIELLHGGQHNNGSADAGVPQLAAYLDAVQLGQHQIQYHQIRLKGMDSLKHGFPIHHTFHIITRLLQIEVDESGNGRLVIDNQDFCLHGDSPLGFRTVKCLLFQPV
ncbi:hypothetical protein D3C75_872970 [compost metagenome]